MLKQQHTHQLEAEVEKLYKEGLSTRQILIALKAGHEDKKGNFFINVQKNPNWNFEDDSKSQGEDPKIEHKNARGLICEKHKFVPLRANVIYKKIDRLKELELEQDEAKNRVLSLDKIAQSIEEHGERNTALGGYFLMKSGYVIEGKTWEESKESLKKMFYGGKK